MTPYGNEHSYQTSDLNSTKHRPNMLSKSRRTSRRLAKKTRRARDKNLLKIEELS